MLAEEKLQPHGSRGVLNRPEEAVPKRIGVPKFGLRSGLRSAETTMWLGKTGTEEVHVLVVHGDSNAAD